MNELIKVSDRNNDLNKRAYSIANQGTTRLPKPDTRQGTSHNSESTDAPKPTSTIQKADIKP